MRRKEQTPLSPGKLLDEVLNSPLHWPWKTIRLERNSLVDYRQRSISTQPSIAELYHENSKIFPQMVSELSAASVELDDFRREAGRRRAAAARSRNTASLDLDPIYQELLAAVVRISGPELFYAIELRITVGSTLGVYQPISDQLYLTKQLSTMELEKLRNALRWMPNAETPRQDGPMFFILGSFARNDVLFGARGYRRTLLEAGRIAQEIIRQAQELGLIIRPLYEFTDREVDAVLEADGTEEGTLMAFDLGGNTDASKG